MHAMIEVSPKLTPKESTPDTTGWKGRHLRYSKSHPVAVMISALDQCQRVHFERYESKIGEDYVLGPAFLDALKGVRTLLNGEIGGLDGGTCDAALLAIYTESGFEGEL